MSDPRGPIQQIVSIEERTDATLLTLSCGHVATCNQIFHYKVGADCRCFTCGQRDKVTVERNWDPEAGDPREDGRLA